VFDTEVGLLTKEEKVIVENKSTLDLNYPLFKDDALLIQGLKQVSIKNKINKQEINMTFDDFPICGIWTSRTGHKCPFISIEPLSGMADTAGMPKELIDKEFIQSIYPDDKYSTKFTIEIK
jgi:galactose mutarotase-like enzyme